MKRTIAGALLVLCILTAVFGSGGIHVVEADIEPLSFESVSYDRKVLHRSFEPRSAFGLGASAAYGYFFSDTVAAGVRISAQTRSFKNFHRFTELMATAEARWNALSFSAGLPVKMFVLGGAGILAGFKDTGDSAVYPLFRAGVSFEAQVTPAVAVKATLLADDSFQKGSNIFGFTLGIGAAFRFGRSSEDSSIRDPLEGTAFEGYQMIYVDTRETWIYEQGQGYHLVRIDDTWKPIETEKGEVR